jgi:hypothetical protein
MTTNERTLRISIDVLAAVVCALGAGLALLGVDTPLRPALVAVGLVLGTGWAATCWFGIREPAFAGSVAVAAGISIIFVFSLLLLEVHWWHPIGAAGGLLIAAGAANLAAAFRDSTDVRGSQ